MKLAAPLLMSDRVDLLLGQKGALDSSKFHAPNGEPRVVDAFHFTVGRPTDQVVAPTSFEHHEGAYFYVSIRTGKHLITDGLIPMWCFDALEYDAALRDGEDGRLMCSMRWKLPKPLFLGPGADLLIEVQRRSDFNGWDDGSTVSAAPQTVEVAAVGRYWPMKTMFPRLAPVPYVSAHVATQTITSRSIIASNHEELLNRLSVPVNLTHMIGKVAVPGAGAASNQLNSLMNAENDPLVRLSAPDKTRIIPSFAPLSMAFPYGRSMLPLSYSLSPADRLMMEFDTVASSGTFFVSFAMHGYRMERAQ